jgi:hypothetical protein
MGSSSSDAENVPGVSQPDKHFGGQENVNWAFPGALLWPKINFFSFSYHMSWVSLYLKCC